jgi:hypothetical protein
VQSCSLHLGSITRPTNIGRVFSTESAPGLIWGVGNVGPFLDRYQDCDTFISLDGGLTWKLAMKGPHKFESVDSGSIFLLVPDGKEAGDVVKYSINRGLDWKDLKVDLGGKWRPRLTMLDADSTSLQVVMYATMDGGANNFVVHIDFSGVFPRQCVIDAKNPKDSKDYEFWNPKSVNKDECFLGQDIGLGGGVMYRVLPEETDC